MTEQEMKTLADMLDRKVGVLMEDVQHKFDLVVEGHQVLADKIDRLEERVERVEDRLIRVEDRLTQVETKVDAVALDLTAHRNDTEAHRTVYGVREP